MTESIDVAKVTAEKQTEAIRAHAEYPRYEGHWDDWVLARITSRISTRLGVAFEKGDLVLVHPDVETLGEFSRYPGRQTRTAYSFRTAVDTCVRADYVQLIAE